jgi:hypothetical protein
MRYQWSKLTRQQIGAYAEYFIKMEFTMYGFQVYSTEVDDRGIDFVCRYKEKHFMEIQVKSIRGLNYVFMKKENFKLQESLWVSLVTFEEGKEPNLYLIPSKVWKTPNELFVNRDYEGKKSKPEWGINISKKNHPKLLEYSFDMIIEDIIN